MKFFAVILAALLVTSVAAAEPVEGPVKAQGVMEPEQDAVIPLQLLPGETSIFIFADEDDAQLACGVFTIDGQPIIVDSNEDDRCGFKLSPSEQANVLVAVENVGTSPAHVTFVAR